MEPDESLAIVCAAMLPFFGSFMGANQPTIIGITVCYVVAAIAFVKYKHYLRRRQ